MMLKLVGRGVAWLMLGAGLLVGWTMWRSEAHLRSFPPHSTFTTPIPTDAATIARGKHLAVTRGCSGCHGDRLQGEAKAYGWTDMGRTVAPNLASYARRESPATIEAAVRQGVGHDGRALYSMPSFNFANLTNADLAAIIAYLRQVPVAKDPLPNAYHGWAPRWAMATGADFAIPHFIAETPLLRHQGHRDAAVGRGEYLAMTSCNECHGFGLRGDNPFDPPGKGPPDLAGARGYAKADFITLMRTGVPPGKRDLGLMKEVARGRFAHWSHTEIDDLYAFLSVLGDAPQ